MVWQLQTAKQQFSALVDETLREGPQTVTRHGREVVVVIAVDEYRQLRGQVPDFKAFLRRGPDLSGLEIVRSSEPTRTVDL